MAHKQLERWSSQFGVILAVAGSAIGLGNFLRFPAKAAMYDGGTFLIPYLCALVCLGLPLMWLEFALGRYGGVWGRHSLPGIFDAVTRRPWGKYLGVFGLYIPFVVVVYYLYVQSWLLGYSYFAAVRTFDGMLFASELSTLLDQYRSGGHGALAYSPLALLFLVITLAINFHAVYRGDKAGIHTLTRIAMPLLCILTVVMVVRIFTLPTALAGLDLLWKPNFAQLANADIWMTAAGQALFSLSLGLGAIITYSSFLRKEDDVALSGLTTFSLNTFAELVLGGTIAIGASVSLFGIAATQKLAAHGPFDITLIALPALITREMPLSSIVTALWFLLLYFVSVTSAVSLLRVIVAFFEDELGWTRARATAVLLLMTAAYLVPLVLFINHGFLQEMDFWGGTFLLVVGALIETLVFLGALGIRRGWEGITAGGRIHLPAACKFVLCIITPLFLLALLGWWGWQSLVPLLTLQGVPPAEQPYHIAARVIMGAVLLLMLLVLKFGWQRRMEDNRVQPRIAVNEEELADVL